VFNITGQEATKYIHYTGCGQKGKEGGKGRERDSKRKANACKVFLMDHGSNAMVYPTLAGVHVTLISLIKWQIAKIYLRGTLASWKR
jgi:hypothetical protein